MEVPELQGRLEDYVFEHPCSTLTKTQRQHSANVMEAPKAYPQQEPAKAQNILLIDCRGLEFVEFKAEVCSLHSSTSDVYD